MEQVFAVIILLFAMLGFLALGLWVGMSMLATGVVAMILFTGITFGDAMATTIWSHTSTWALSSLPLFIWMGEILFRSKLSENLFAGLSPILRRTPGGLLHVNVLGSSTFAAISGSSAATLATVGKMTIPELQKRGYPESLTIGTLAGASTIGLLIPPSLTLIVYGVLVQESIGRLFIAGVMPGIMLSFLFFLYIFGWGQFTKQGRSLREAPATIAEKLHGAAKLLPVFMLIAAVIGSIFFGLATPIEAAAIGVVGALLLALIQGTLNRESLRASLLGTVKTMSMIMLLIVGSSFLTMAMAFSGLPGDLARWVGGMGLSATGLIIVLTIFFLVLGMFLDGFSMIILTIAVLEPLLRATGIDMIWFGIFLVMVCEVSLITPPIGFNLFLLQGMTGKGIGEISKAAFPMFLLLLAGLALLIAFPEIATWLPNYMTRGN